MTGAPEHMNVTLHVDVSEYKEALNRAARIERRLLEEEMRRNADVTEATLTDDAGRLTELADHTSSWVRRAVRDNPATPDHVRAYLALAAEPDEPKGRTTIHVSTAPFVAPVGYAVNSAAELERTLQSVKGLLANGPGR